jgi:hypothetical protein
MFNALLGLGKPSEDKHKNESSEVKPKNATTIYDMFMTKKPINEPSESTEINEVLKQIYDNEKKSKELKIEGGVPTTLILTMPGDKELTLNRNDVITTQRIENTSWYNDSVKLGLSDPIQRQIIYFETDSNGNPSGIGVNDTTNSNPEIIKLNKEDLLKPGYRLVDKLLWTTIQKVTPSKGGAKRKRSKSAKRRQKRNHRRDSRKHTK